MIMKKIVLVAILFVIIVSWINSPVKNNGFIYSKTSNDDSTPVFMLIQNKNGPVLRYSRGVKIITSSGLSFKDLNRNGKLDKYEDWKLSVDEIPSR